jgi:hypothetical protein
MHPSVARARELHDLVERYIETRRRAFLPQASMSATCSSSRTPAR